MPLPRQSRQEWRETSLKGRMAESLVYDLLRESGSEVYRIGFEAILPGLTRIEESFARKHTVGEKVRGIPDFFVIDRAGEPHLIEVKFRWHPAGHESDFERLARLRKYWEEAGVIFVNCSEKPYFRFCMFPFVDEARKIIARPLVGFSAFGITLELVEKFDTLVEKYLHSTLVGPVEA